ncbi:GNAT family N-acetyltransferase [Streptomyces sp. NPDC012600]|uniref:GNAT family N-acetyltransferase n=1 Tax=Streptomyces sp. NPDC012600 TaxID=3415005 RepID=UPI003C2CEB5C
MRPPRTPDAVRALFLPEAIVDIRRATTVTELLAAGRLFDAPPREEWAARFLAADGHVLLIAYVDGAPAGFVSGIEMLHPDKGTEMCLYELGVDEPFRRRGIGRALTRALVDLARERGCYGLWVGVEPGNEAALATYRAAGAAAEDGQFAMLTWEFAADGGAG